MVDHYEGEDVIITFERDAGAAVTDVTGKITNITISGGEENTEVKYAFGNKQILFGKPKEKLKVEFEVILDNSDEGGILSQAFLGGTTVAAGTVFESSSAQDYWRIGLWFIPYAKITTAGLPPLTNPDARVMLFVDCRAVSFEKKFESEDTLVGTVSFELAATDSNGYANHYDYFTNSTTSTLIQIGTTTAYDKYRGRLTWTTAAWTSAYAR